MEKNLQVTCLHCLAQTWQPVTDDWEKLRRNISLFVYSFVVYGIAAIFYFRVGGLHYPLTGLKILPILAVCFGNHSAIVGASSFIGRPLSFGWFCIHCIIRRTNWLYNTGIFLFSMRYLLLEVYWSIIILIGIGIVFDL
jgi:hypothetical protein